MAAKPCLIPAPDSTQQWTMCPSRARSTRPLSSRRTRRAGGAGMGFLCAGSAAGGPGRWGRCWPFLRSRATSNQTTSDVVIASERADHRPRRGLTSFVFACFDSRVRDVPRGIRYVIGRVRVGLLSRTLTRTPLIQRLLTRVPLGLGAGDRRESWTVDWKHSESTSPFRTLIPGHTLKAQHAVQTMHDLDGMYAAVRRTASERQRLIGTCGMRTPAC